MSKYTTNETSSEEDCLPQGSIKLSLSSLPLKTEDIETNSVIL